MDGNGRILVIGGAAAARMAARVSEAFETRVVADEALAREVLDREPVAAVVVALGDADAAEAACARLFRDRAGGPSRRHCVLLAVAASEADVALRLCERGLFDDYVLLDHRGDPHRPVLALRHAIERRSLQDSIVARLDQLASIRREIGESGWRIGRRLVIGGGDLRAAGELAVDVAGAFARADLALGGCAFALSTALQPFATGASSPLAGWPPIDPRGSRTATLPAPAR